MYKYKVSLTLLISCFLFGSCLKKEESEITQIEIEDTTIKEVVTPTIEKTDEIKKEPEIENNIEEELPKKEEIKPQVIQEEKIKEEVPDDEEYSRSIGDNNISKDTFLEDKAEILKMIAELSEIMKNKNFKEWLSYIDSDSISYWKKSENLRKAQKRLPIKGLPLKNLEDYFKFVFIPARQNRNVNEIRYISNENIKAIESTEKIDSVYYYFRKINNKWKVHLPELES